MRKATRTAGRAHAALFVAILVGGCGAAHTDGARRAGVGVIDELGGTYQGVGLGAPPGAIRKRFGRPARFTPSAGIMPVGQSPVDVAGPNFVAGPGGRGRDRVLRFRGVSFLTHANVTFAFLVTARDVRTRRGIGVGDSLAAVRKRYLHLRCASAEDAHGAPDFPYCGGRIAARRYIFFAGDPIASISVASTPLS